MSLLKLCSECEREDIGGSLDTGICHRCRDTALAESTTGEATPDHISVPSSFSELEKDENDVNTQKDVS